MPRKVLVETTEDGNPIRIFRNGKAAVKAALAGRYVTSMRRAEAVGLIREMVRHSAGDVCQRCGAILTKETGEMHETLPKGKGGEVSLDNCEWLCHACHQGRPDSAHGDRRTRFGESVNGGNTEV
jgi:5-methylcytosine-specific restriction endonuclease McrA